MLEAPQLLHAPGTGEYTLCGFAYDAFDSGDEDNPIIFANLGQVITCEDCRKEIDHVKQSFRKYKYIGI